MDFNSKNFRYVTDSFGNIMTKIQAGGRMYLRSLSHEKPSERPANIEKDFPRLAEDFSLPQELDYVKKSLFSSVLRVSGRVNMWLHYDVCHLPSPIFPSPKDRSAEERQFVAASCH